LIKKPFGLDCEIYLTVVGGEIAAEGNNDPKLTQSTSVDDQRRGNNGFPAKEKQHPETRPYSPPPPPKKK
jgi:hypothetical protein